MTEVKFFLFGSMCTGLVHESLIKDFIKEKVNAFTRGTAYKLKVGFPVFVEDGMDHLAGELVSVVASDVLVGLLDEFHGYRRDDESKSLYFRREIDVQTEFGSEKAWAYVINPKKLTKEAKVISGQMWRQDLAQEVPLTERLTDRQKTYIKRLGASTGREIVPIDLGLYRELMSLELIVDKGRRLALSKLGHEVCRYIG